MTELYYTNRTIYQENIDSQWYAWTGSTWVSTSNPTSIKSSPGLNITAAQLVADATLLGRITSSYDLEFSSAAVLANLAGLQTLAASSGLSSIFLTDSSTVSLPGTEIVDANQNVWTVVGGIIQENGTAVPSNAVTELYYANGTIYQENIDSQWYALTGSTWISVVNPPVVAPPTLTVTAAQFSADAAALTKIVSAYNLIVTGVAAANAATVAAQPHVISETVADTSTNVVANLAALQSLVASSKLTSISLTDSSTPTLTITAAPVQRRRRRPEQNHQLLQPGRDRSWRASAHRRDIHGVVSSRRTRVGPCRIRTITSMITNAGTIEASGGTLTLGAAVTGTGTLLINAASTVELAAAATAGIITDNGTLKLDGQITTATGLAVTTTGSVTGQGTIAAAITNVGTISSTGGTLSIAGSLTETGTMNVATGAVLAATGGGTIAGSITGTGSLSLSGAAGFTTNGALNVGTTVINKANLMIGFGQLAFLGGVTNNGTIAAGANTASFSQNIGGTGVVTVGAGGVASLLGGSTSSESVSFLAASGTIDLGSPLSFLGAIGGFVLGDKIDLLLTIATSESLLGSSLTLTGGNRTAASLHMIGSYTNASFNLGSDGHGGTLITHS